MPQTFSDIFRRQFQPLEPIPTGETPVLRELPGVRAVLFDVYGTLFISGSGDVGATKEAACEAAMIDAIRAAGIVATGPICDGVGLLAEQIDASHAASRAAGIECPEVDIVEVWREVLLELARRGAIDPKAAEQADPRRLAVEVEARANPCWPMPGVRECLDQLRRRGLPLGIVSNAQFYTVELFEALLGGPPERWGFQPDLQFYSYQQGRAKPGTAMFEQAAEALRRREIGPGEVLYVGNDMLNDVFPAARVGFRTALFAGDRRSLRLRQEVESLEGISPDLVVTDLSRIPGCVC